MSSPLSLGASAASCAVAVLLSIPHGHTLITRFRCDKSYTLTDTDSDDVITTGKYPRSLAQRVCLVAVGVVAVTTALCSLMSRTITIPQVLQCISWVVILFQNLVILRSRNPMDRYNLGWYTALATLVTAISVSLPYALALYNGEHLPTPGAHHAATIVQLLVAVILFLVNLSLPRGPTIYRDGRPIDAQDSVSFLNRYTFFWAYRTMSLAMKKGKLDPEDLPLVPEEARAQTLTDRFLSADPTSVRWRKWMKLYWRPAVLQVTIQLTAAVVGFLPNILLLTILRLFEDRDAGADNQLQLWLTALGLGSAMIANSWLIALRDFIADLKISLPINQQLIAVVSKKSLGLKDVAVPARDNSSDDSEDEEDDGDEKPPQSKHSILNLLGVDVEKVSGFIAYSHLLLDCVVDSILTSAFLVYLMGWKATAAGCIIPVLLVPFYYSITKRYSEKEQALMERRDEKSASLTEMIHGIRQIKFSALEAEWFNKIQKLRGKELREQKAVFWMNIVLNGMYTLVPIFMSCFSIAAYVYLNGSISPSTAFTALSLFDTLRNTICILPEVVTELLDAKVSLGRIARFLGLEDHADGRVADYGDGNGMTFDNATIAWPSNRENTKDEVEGAETFLLKELNLSFPSQALSIISGRSGAGKSLLLQALIGEADVVKGNVVVPLPKADAGPSSTDDWLVRGSVAYVSQDPWIENATIRDSILFGLQFNPARYEEVLHACALRPDLNIFPDGDKTDIGANGINLSGGQKWRLALARALYSRASILVLDDIFSAVDAHVGQHLYENALTGSLAEGRTRVLATHHVRLCLQSAAYVVKLDNGRVVHARHQDTSEEVAPETTDSSQAPSRAGSPDPIKPIRRESVSVSATKKFYEEEKRETGVIKAKVYNAYIDASGGYSPWLVTAAFLIILLLLNLAIPYWVSIWTRSYETDRDKGDTLFAQSGDMIDLSPIAVSSPILDTRLIFYGSIYIGISLGAWILEVIRIGIILHSSLKASKTMFEQFTTTILHAPMRFLDTTPVGQILNRFTSDFGTLDSDIALDLAYLLHDVTTVLAVIVAATVTSPLIVGLGILSLGASWIIGYIYVTGAREAKRLQSIAKSPIFDLVGSLLTGLPTIRAFGREQAYLKRMYDLIDTYCQALWHRKLFASWRAIWLSAVGAVFVAAVTMTFVSIRTLDAPLAGFALSFALDMSSNITWLLSQYASLEIDSNAAERIVEYTQLEQEPQSGTDVPAGWPNRGEVEVTDLTVAYSPDLPPVLKNLNFVIPAGQRVGVVGRTGAGKSSFAMTLLRCLDVRTGSIHIDGVDIAGIRLRDLRERVGLISQDPVVFAGSVRQVLDPFNQHDDRELLVALEKVGLSSPAQPFLIEDTDTDTTPSTLSLTTPIASSGKNLSQGQRQLLCLARALVSRPKTLIMDEATASIDMESDQRIQRALREEVSAWGCTLIVIAHRLSTIADFDCVVVLERGEVVEMGAPRDLMGIVDGVFRGMVMGSGERGVVEGVFFGDGK
ncbi:putative ABC transporter [Aspergillus mulundensis]|uniref:Putative ABC bile acid transporter n=1 Tax=Aspergillus mulundensis TaxID=1810919 RepID=A0A3D8SBF8_9EURO|nr:putative ABC bile acid transporter [Aspergillus mulundensis]RDW83603.1 putative ABC bile acid transporter [Aspergillus mulundensis]